MPATPRGPDHPTDPDRAARGALAGPRVTCPAAKAGNRRPRATYGSPANDGHGQGRDRLKYGMDVQNNITRSRLGAMQAHSGQTLSPWTVG